MRPALSDYQHLASGKVREIYRVDDEHLLLVASDRISAYDYVLDSTIPDKGRILTAMSVFFFGLVEAPNHLAGPPDDPRIPDEVLGRALVVRRLEMFPVECVARGYLTGSGLLDYQATGKVCGIPLPPELVEASKFATPLFTPATKAALGDHDENISFARTIETGGRGARQPAARPHAADLCPGRRPRADGRESSSPTPSSNSASTTTATCCWPTKSSPRIRRGTGRPMITGPAWCRTALTSNSSATGSPVPASGWDRGGTAPPPPLPDDIVDATRDRYIDAYERISGLSFSDWIGPSA